MSRAVPTTMGDIGFFYGYAGSLTNLFVSNGTATGLPAPALHWSSGAGNWVWAGSRLVGGDFNGDGKGDIGIMYDYGAANGAIWMMSGGNGNVSAPIHKWTSGVGNWEWNYTKLAAGDFNKDGKGDIAAFVDNGYNNAELWSFSGTTNGFGIPAAKWYSGPGNWTWANNKFM